MAVASYTTDLTDITLAESTTGWSALGGGASGLATNADSSMQGTYGIGKQITAAEKGQVYGSGGTSISAGRHVFIWIFLTTPGLAAALASRGLTAVIGSSTTAYCQYHVEGNDTYGATGRVGKCYPIDPSVYTSNTGSSPYRTVTGSPSGTYAQFGAVANITGTVKGENLVVDAIRHGTGVYVTGGTSTDPAATFSGLATQNDANDGTAGFNRWGVFSKIGGGYELQGKLAIGQNSSGTATECRFTDSNVSITLPENPHVASTFNKIILDHASSVITWTNVTINSLGLSAPGTFDVTSNDPTVNLTNCNFLNMSSFILDSNTTATGCAWRGGTVQVFAYEATITDCVFSKFTSAISLTATPAMMANITGNFFESDGSNHAVDLGTVASTTSFDWDNTTSGYATSDGSTGNETIKVNVSSGQTLTINVAAGATTPSIYNTGSGTVTVVSGAVNVKVKAVTSTGTAVSGARIFLEADSGGNLPSYASVSISNSGTTATVTHSAHAMLTGDKVCIRGASLDANNGVFVITKIDANSYSYTMGSTPGSSPTGTITATYVAISDTTDGTGYNSTPVSRAYTAAQPVKGQIRKSSSAPYYKNAPLSGSISTSTGLDISGVLILDD